jgi:hypothetical protein
LNKKISKFDIFSKDITLANKMESAEKLDKYFHVLFLNENNALSYLFKVFLNNKILSVHTYFKVDFAN